METVKNFFRLLLVLAAFTTNPHLSASEITVFAAASLTDVLKEIAADYEQRGADKVILNFGASSTLARQIEEGAPADLFFSADDAQMNRVERKDLIVKATRRNLLSNTLVIVVAAENGALVRGPQDLGKPEIQRLALGDPRAVPIGVYAEQYLKKEGVWEGVAAKIVPTENVRAALAAVESGNAEASIVYKTDALISKKVTIAYAVPESEGPDIRYPAALTTQAKEPAAAAKFLSCLESESAAKVFEKYGFVAVRHPGK